MKAGADTPAALPGRAERLRQVREVIGEPGPGSEIVPERAWSYFADRYDEIVGPLIERTWPADEDPENREHFLSKSRFIARRYASLAYVPVALGTASPVRSLPLAATLERLTVGTVLGLAEPIVVRATAAVVPALVAAAPIDLRVTILLAGMCTAYDQCFDDWPGDTDPEERHRHLTELWRDPEGDPLLAEPPSTALTRALLVEIRAGLGDRYEELADLGVDASAAEMRIELGKPDPEALAHRRPAAEGTVDGMMIQTTEVAPEVRDWMRDLAVFVQLIDDWVDAETDVALRETPVLTGAVGLRDIEERWLRLLDDSGTMLRASGIHERRVADLVEDAVRYVLWSGIEGMESRVAD